MFIILILMGVVPLSYFLGAIPCGLILTRLFASKNITATGSKNIGATNVRRITGSRLGGLTLLGDMAKGALPVYWAANLAGAHFLSGEIIISLAALAAFAGHLYPIYLKFKNGGKGVATGAGCFLMLSPMGGIVSILVFILVICMTNRASMGSLAGSAILPLSVWVASGSAVFALTAAIMTVFIFYRHRDNIKRLLAGTEPVIWDSQGRS